MPEQYHSVSTSSNLQHLLLSFSLPACCRKVPSFTPHLNAFGVIDVPFIEGDFAEKECILAFLVAPSPLIHFTHPDELRLSGFFTLIRETRRRQTLKILGKTQFQIFHVAI
jgi:hypothetical protein